MLAVAVRCKRALVCGAALIAVGFAGCGNNRVFVDVDVRSFMQPSDLVNPYAAPPFVAASSRLDPIQVNLVEDFGGGVEAVTLDLTIDYVNQTGSGDATFTLYLGDDAATLFGTPSVGTLNATLQPGTTTSGTIRIQADQRVADLFSSQRLFLGAELGWASTGSDPVQGECIIAQLKARVASRLSIF